MHEIHKLQKTPSFPFYPKDWLSDFVVGGLTYEQKGMYLDLLCYSWFDELICDINAIALRLHCDSTAITYLLEKFFYAEDGRYKNKKLEQIKCEITEYRQRKSEAGKRGNKARYGENKPENDDSRSAIALASPSSPSSSPLPLSNSLKKEKIYKKENSENPIWIKFCELIDSVGLINQVKPDLYLDTITEYSKKGAASVEVRECLYWCRDKGKRIVTIMRIRNWLKNWAKYQKDKELKQLTENQDKRMQVNKFVLPKQSKVWEPPL